MLQRRVYMDWGMERIYPNLYIVLLGPSAQTRKSTALKIGEELVKKLSIPMIGQDNSPEAVIRSIKENLLTFKDSEGDVKFQSAMTCFASELAVFLGRQNTDFQAYLTDWYDSPDEWTRTTKHQGVDDITGMCFNLIGAMAPDWIPHIFMPESIGGGFTSRIVFVPENRKAKTIANPNKFPPPEGLRDSLLYDLEKIRQIAGPYILSKEAENFYEEWYTREDAKIMKGNFPVPDPAFQHYCGRRGTLIRKLSISITASRSSSRVVLLEDIHEALAMMEDVESRMPGTFASVGRTGNSYQNFIVRRTLASRGEVLRSELLRELRSDLSLSDLEDIEKTLEASKEVKITKLTGSNDTRYKWIG